MTREEINQEKQKEIEYEENRERRKHIVLIGLKTTFFLIVFFFAFYFYTTYISTGSLIVKEERVINEKIPSSFDGVKVIQFSDLHYGTTVTLKNVRRLVKEINERNPDLVVFTGDLIDQDYDITIKEQEKLTKYLGEINATLGKYAIAGDEDGSSFTTIFNQSEFNILNNSYDLIYKNDNNPILLVGLGSYLKEDIEETKAYSYFNEPTHNANIYTITLMHEPDSYDDISGYSNDLMLAGHSLNGTIRLPIVGGLKKVDGAKNYNGPYYELDNSVMYISSGIGTKDPGFRLFNKPSISLFRLSHE